MAWRFARITHFTFTIFQKSHYGRGCTASFIICNNYRFVAFHYGHATIGGS